MNRSDILQDLSLEFNSMVKKNLGKIKKLDPKTQRELGKLLSNFKDGLDDLTELDEYIGQWSNCCSKKQNDC